MTLGTPTNATLGSTPSDMLTIAESDPQPTVAFAGAAQTVNETAGTFSVTVNMSSASIVATDCLHDQRNGNARLTTTALRSSSLRLVADNDAASVTGNLLAAVN